MFRNFLYLKFMMVIVLSILLLSHANADDKTQRKQMTPNPSIQKSEAGLSEPYVGKVQLARSLIGAKVKDANDRPMGKIEDVSLDIGQGKIHAVYISPEAPISPQRETMIIPYATLTKASNKTDFIITKLPMKDEKEEKNPDDANSESKLILVNKQKSD